MILFYEHQGREKGRPFFFVELTGEKDYNRERAERNSLEIGTVKVSDIEGKIEWYMGRP